MAMTGENYDLTDKNQKNLLEIGAEQFYFDKLRPYMVDMQLKCKTDEILNRSIDKVINSCDSLCINKNYNDMLDVLDIIMIPIMDKNYFEIGAMKRATENEKNIIRELITKIQDLKLILKYEEVPSKEEKQPKERLDYSPNGENQSFSTHNMKELSKPNPKRRIPNS